MGARLQPGRSVGHGNWLAIHFDYDPFRPRQGAADTQAPKAVVTANIHLIFRSMPMISPVRAGYSRVS